MAVNTSRSMNAELREGFADATTRNVHPNRAGEVDVATRTMRSLLHDDYGYGFISVDPPEYMTGEEWIPR